MNEAGICPNTGQLCKEVIELKTKVEHIEKSQEATKQDVNEIKDSIREVVEFQGGTKVYVSEIKQQITTLETRLFTFMNDLVKNLTTNNEKADDTAAKERQKSMDRWIDLLKWVLGCTIVAIIAYIFGKGM